MFIARDSNLLGKITVLIIVGLYVNTTLALDGSGTEENPWRIKSLADFDDFAADVNYWDDYTKLETDVNLAGRVYSKAVIAPDISSSVGFQGISFYGVFDGNDHKITNLTIDDGGAGNDYLGLFGYIGEGELRNLNLECSSVSGSLGSGHYSELVGGLAGINLGSILNCYSTGDVNGIYIVGGLVGWNHLGGSVSDCYSTSDVNGFKNVGGLAGINAGSILNCYSISDVTGYDCVGGLVGYHYDGSVLKCYSTGDVSGDRSVGGAVGSNGGSISNCYSTGDVSGTGSYVGGLAGGNWGIVLNCYSNSDVSGERIIGGLVGFNGFDSPYSPYPGFISNCYSIGNVQGDSNVGGLVGYNELGDIEHSYWNIETSGEPNMCGDYDIGLGCDNSYGFPTSQLHQQSTFTNWDFINVWNIGENQTYPYLRVYFAADLNKDGIVNFLDVAITANQWMEGAE